MAVSKTNDPGGTQGKIKNHPRMKILIQKTMMLYVVAQYIWTSKIHRLYKDNPNYALFSYEDLLNDPENIVRKVCEFVKIDFVPEMLMPKEGQASSVTSERRRGFNRKAAYHWKERITPIEEKIILTLTKSSMKRFGYDPENHPIYKSMHEGEVYINTNKYSEK